MPKGTKNANAIRALAMDAVQKAGCGHPGAPMGMAEIAEVLWISHLKHNPKNPGWPDRDRFVLSNGHGSMLLYSMLHLSGYDLSLEQLKKTARFQNSWSSGIWRNSRNRDDDGPARTRVRQCCWDGHRRKGFIKQI